MPVKKGKGCVADVMREWKSRTLHSGKGGEVVKDREQAIAIALSMCGKSKDKTFEERPRGRMIDTAFMPGETAIISARFGESCGCKHKKGSPEYADCNCGCKSCKKRVPMAIGYPTPTFSEEDTKMALAQLRKLRANTSHLIMMMESEMMRGNTPEIESWMESKITLAADYLAAVHDYAMYGPGLEIEEKEDENEEYSDDNDRMTKLKLFGFVETALKSTYAKGLTKAEQGKVKKQAEATMKKGKEGASAKSVYEPWDTDKAFLKRNKGKMPKSESTLAYERMYGNDSEDMAEASVSANLKKKSEKSGIPVSILRQVFKRGMAAWQSGHRPGMTPQQWSYARVNSFITGSGSARKADADLWKKAGKR